MPQSLPPVGFPVNFYDQSGLMGQQGLPYMYQHPSQQIRNPYEFHTTYAQAFSQEPHPSFGRPRVSPGGAAHQTRTPTYDNLCQSILEGDRMQITDSHGNPHLKNYFPFLQKDENIHVKVVLNPVSAYQSVPYSDPYLSMAAGSPWPMCPYSVNPFMPMMSVGQPQMAPQMFPQMAPQMQLYGGHCHQASYYPVGDGYKLNQEPRSIQNNHLERNFSARQDHPTAQAQLTMPVWNNNGGSERQFTGIANYQAEENPYKEPKKTFETTIMNDSRHLEIHKTPADNLPAVATPNHQALSVIVPESKNISFPTPSRPKASFKVESEPGQTGSIIQDPPVLTIQKKTHVSPPAAPSGLEATRAVVESPKIRMPQPKREPESEPSVKVKKTRKYTRRPPVIREVIDKPFKRVRHPPKVETCPKMKIRKIKKTINRFARGRYKEPVERQRQPRKITPSIWNDHPVIQKTNHSFKAEMSVHPIIPRHLEGVLELISWAVPERTIETPQKIAREIRPHQIRVESDDPPSSLSSEFSEEKVLKSMVKKVAMIWIRRPTNLPNVFTAIYLPSDDPQGEAMVWQTTDYSNKKISNMQELVSSEESGEDSYD